MGCICSKGTSTNDVANEKQREKKELSTSSVQLVASSRKGDVVVEVGGGGSGSVRPLSRQALPPTLNGSKDSEKNTIIVERPTNVRHQRRATMDIGPKGGQALQLSRLVSMPDGAQGEQIVSGWPSWLTSVAGEAIQGWVPRRADSFEKLDKVSPQNLLLPLFSEFLCPLFSAIPVPLNSFFMHILTCITITSLISMC